MLKDRLDKLIEEINDLRNAHKAKRLRYKQSSSEQPNSPEHLEQQEKIVSASETNLVPLNLELNHQLQSEMELHTNCSSESQVIILRVSESEDNLVQLTGSQYQMEFSVPKLTTSESDNTQTETGTESPIPIAEPESSQTGTESPIPVLIPESEDSQTGSQSPIPTTTNLESETDSQTDTGTECPESKPSRKSELTPGTLFAKDI